MSTTSCSRGCDKPRDVLDFLGQRHSVGPKHLAPPAPSDTELAEAAALALRAPDHRGLRPFRFVQIGDDGRTPLAELFARGAAQRGRGTGDVAEARARAHNGPALVGLVAHVRPSERDVPAHEQWISVGAGLMNFLNALHLMGYGAKVLSGSSVRDPVVRQALCQAGEELVAWIAIGTPTRRPRPKSAPDDGAEPTHAPAALSRWPAR